ncbi:MAG: ribosome biogenesis GTP-binding protein YihA/YsxC [Clostridium sp.]|nr:ribosome biogenesis GTP-binding protein YihA/YsxC [Clostridium sp.]
MIIKKARFITSAAKLSQCPDFNLPEIALLGRSNVGKSSFINGLTNNSKLAKTSNKPGKTRLINLFEFDEKYIVADLPGYGYAKVSKEIQNEWQKNLEEYLLKRDSLKLLVQFIDSRHEIQKNDLQMQEWLFHHKLDSIVIATKIDLTPKSKIQSKINELKKVTQREVLPFSTQNNRYNENIIKLIENSIL